MFEITPSQLESARRVLDEYVEETSSLFLAIGDVEGFVKYFEKKAKKDVGNEDYKKTKELLDVLRRKTLGHLGTSKNELLYNLFFYQYVFFCLSPTHVGED